MVVQGVSLTVLTVERYACAEQNHWKKHGCNPHHGGTACSILSEAS